MQDEEQIADRDARRQSAEMESVAASRQRLPGRQSLAFHLSGAAFAIGASLFFFDRIASAARADLLAYDFRQTFFPAAEALLHGHSPYPAYGYPPLVAFLSVPFAITDRPDILVTVVMVALLPLSLWLLDVRDWRCYAVVLLWGSVFNAVQTANVTLPIVVGLAACWRWRDRSRRAAVTGGLTAAAKIIAWPLVVWFAATRRWGAAAGTVVVAAGVTFGLWAVLGFSGLGGYLNSLGSLADSEAPNGYTIQALASDAGLSGPFPGLLGSALALAALAGIVIYARRGDEARAYACTVAAVIVASPIVWLHSFALLLVPVAILRPRLSPVWLLPAAFWFYSTGTGNGSSLQTALTLGTAALVIVAVLRPTASKELEVRWDARRRTATDQTT